MTESTLGAGLPLVSVVPFAGMLLSIALGPLVAPHAWHRHYPKVAAGWAVLFALPFIVRYRIVALHEIAHIGLADYGPFLVLLIGLYTVAGGLVVRGTLRGTPAVNTSLLAAGTLLASWIGTTGASMVLIRPLLRANAGRTHKTHVMVFFIFLVANVGGALTPLGDPPLFLGFLQGVPFFWTLRLYRKMALVALILLAVFYVIDLRYERRQRRGAAAPSSPGIPEPFRLDGAVNLALLAGILCAVLLSGTWHPGHVRFLGVELAVENVVRDVAILALAGLSLRWTPASLRRANDFTWGPIREVAWLFAGIFVTIIPALAILKAGESGSLAALVHSIETPRQFFWATGVLSSFLDNAPTYLAFFHNLLGRFGPGLPQGEALRQLISHNDIYLQAVAAGSVFMGANTYIGNAPNFMIKAIAEESGVAMPSFFGYILRWTVPFLLPVFVLLGWLFY